MSISSKGLILRGITRHFIKTSAGAPPSHTPQTFSDFYVAGEPMAANTSDSSQDTSRAKSDIITGDIIIGADRAAFDRGGQLVTELGYEVGDTISLFGVNLAVVNEYTTVDQVINSVYDYQDDILYSLDSYGDSVGMGINDAGNLYFERRSTQARQPLTKPGLTKLFGNLTWSTGVYQGGRYISSVTYTLADPLPPLAGNDHLPWSLGRRFEDFDYGGSDAVPRAGASQVGSAAGELATIGDLINHINNSYSTSNQLYEAHLDGSGHLVIFGDLFDYPNPWLGSAYGDIGYSGSQNQSLEIMHGFKLVDGNSTGTGLSYQDNIYVWTHNGEVLGVGGHDDTMSKTIIANATITYQSGTVVYYGDNTELPVPRNPVVAPPHTHEEGNRNLYGADVLVDLGYTVGEEISIHQLTPSDQVLSSFAVESGSTVSDLIAALSGAGYGVRLSNGDGSNLLLYSTYGVTVELVNGSHLNEDSSGPMFPPPGGPGGFGGLS